MSDLISRAEAIRIASGYCHPANIAEELRKLPAAVPERPTGHWIKVDDAYNRISGRCSKCGWVSHLYEDDVVGMDFCPNCGADMRGEQDE